MGTWVPKGYDSVTKKVDVSGLGAYDLVYNRFDLSKSYASESFTLTEEFINALETWLDELELPPLTEIDDVAIPSLEPLDYDARPALGDITLTAIPTDSPEEPEWYPVPSFTIPTFPANSATAPTYETPEKPEQDTIPDLGDTPTMTDPDYPTKPDLVFPTVPNLADIEFPSPPSITLPEFDATVPTETWDLPATFSYTESTYASDVWADLLSKVLNDIRYGGTGLDATVEDELYDKALRRQETENERFYQEIEDFFEARGHDLPPGALAARLYEAGREITRNNSAMAAEIMIDQAKLAQENTHFMVDKGIQLEGILRDFFNAQAARAFEAQKLIAQTAIDVFNAQVNKFNAKINAYQAQAAVYESEVKAAFTQVEIYKSQIEACKVTAEAQKNLVDIYVARVQALDVYCKLYATEMEATKIKAEVEQAKIEGFRLLVQTYIARIEANKAKFEVYIKELEGEKTKAETYAEQVRAYMTEVEAVKTELEAHLQIAEIALKSNQQLTEQYKAELAAFETEIRAVSAENAAQIDAFKSETLAYSAETEAEGSWFRAKCEEMKTGVEQARLKLEKAKAEIAATLDGYLNLKQLQLKGSEGILNVGAQLCASAMTAVTATASIGYSSGQTESEGWQHEETITESHPYEDQEI